MKIFLSIVPFLLLVLSAAGQLSPLPNSTSETWYDPVPVSGEIRTGIMAGISCDAKVKDYFFVKVPARSKSKYLNVEMVTSDGRYVYQANYLLEGRNDNEEVIELIRRTEMPEKMLAYRCSDIAILAWISDDITAQKDEFVISSWQNDFDSNKGFVYLNSENPALIYIGSTIKGGSSTEPCVSIEGKANVAYNCLCEIDFLKIKSSAEISIVQRVRRSQNRYDLNIKF